VTKEVVAFYARVSSDEQREQHTIQTQLEYARGRAKLDGWTLREFVDDGISGKKVPFAKRAGGAALLEAARRGEVSRVVTYRLDRVGRRAKLIHEAIEDLARAGVPYASLTEPFDTATPAGRLFLGVLAVMAEFESDSIAQRTSDGKKRAATIDDRRLTGVIPYGYARGEGQRLVIDPDEADVVKQIYAWASEVGPTAASRRS
jgi:site-specific DNA recombinase